MINNYPRNRDFKKECSLWNPLFLQHNFLIKTVKDFFSNLPNYRSLLIYDLGCGQKPYEVFVPKEHKYIGVDIDEANVNADIHADILDLPIEDESADIVTNFCVLEHVENPQKALGEMYRICKKNGEVFMLIPLYWEEHEQPYDFFRFTRFGIESLMKNVGFSNIQIIEVNSNPAILGMHLARFFDRRFFRILIPLINLFFYKMEERTLKKAKENNTKLSNVMTFAVKGKK